MKYTVTILMSLLLLGVHSATMDGNMQRRDADNSKAIQDTPVDGGQRKTEDLNSQQMEMGLLKDTVYQKLRNTYQQLNGNPYGEYLYLFGDSPVYTDPVHVGSTEDKHGLLTVNYDSVQFLGLNSSSPANLRIETESQMIYLSVSMRKAEISGHYKSSEHYKASDHKSGTFHIKMAGHLTYLSKFRYEMVNSSYVQLYNISGELFYNTYMSDYENLGSYPSSMQKDLQHNLLQMVNEKLRQEMYAEYSDTIRDLILHPITIGDHSEDMVEKVMRNGIDNAVNGIQQLVSKQRGFSIDLPSDNKEMADNKLRAKITSLKLNGIEKFYLVGNQISKEMADKIRAKVELAVDRPTATAVLSIQEARDADAPFQKINVNFEMEQLMANLWVDKSTRHSGLELRSVQTKVNRIWPMDLEKLDGQVSHLIKEKLADHMKHSIEEGLKNFLENELSNIMSRDKQMRKSSEVRVLRQEKQSAQGQM